MKHKDSTVERYLHPNHPSMSMWLDKDFWDSKTQYDDAFVGSPNLGLEDLFPVVDAEVMPTSPTYLTTPSGAARTYPVWVRGRKGESLHWVASLVPPTPDWLSVQQSSGYSSQPIILTMTPASLPLGVTSARLHILSDTPGVQDSDQTITVTMRVVPQLYPLHLPVIWK